MIDKIETLNHNKMQIIWDIGPRCNFDCSYCTSYMHNNYSKHASLEELIKTADFLEKYYGLYKQYHNDDVEYMNAGVSFTGGEPVTNPNFWNLAAYMKDHYEFDLGLTTNGTWPTTHHEKILKYFGGVTISYHVEGPTKSKELIKENILALANADIWSNVNVMMHADHWDECHDLIENFLKPNGINYTPRVIGDGGHFNTDWFKDSDGGWRRTVHAYEPDQLDYIKNHWKKENKGELEKTVIIDNMQEKELAPIVRTDKKEVARKLGRMCCGGRTMCTSNNGQDEKEVRFIEDTRFKNWNCMINWFFLHIEQGNDLVLHHQTCKMKFDGTTGPIGKLSESDKILETLETQLSSGTMPMIKCANNICGCGMCIHKAKNPEDAVELFNKYTKNLTPTLEPVNNNDGNN